MQASSQRAGRYENAVLDLAEAAALAPRVGEMFEGAVVAVDRKDRRRGEMMLREPAIMARIDTDAELPLGEPVRVRLQAADPASPRFRVVVDGASAITNHAFIPRTPATYPD